VAYNGGNGGNGLASSITGTSIYRAGGGGGYPGQNTPGTHGLGSGANTGGGGQGGGSAGDSGVIIFSFPLSRYTGVITGSPTVSIVGTNVVLVFTSSGTYLA
jgi:hypothetical protein